MAANPQIVPSSLELAGASADLATLDRLRPLPEDLQKLVARMSDSVDLLGSDGVEVALDGYAQLNCPAVTTVWTTCAGSWVRASSAATAARSPSQRRCRN